MSSERKWFRTLNDQIIAVNFFINFWIEDIESIGEWHVFGQDQTEADWRIAKFNNEEEAKDYLESIYKKLME